MFSGSRAPFASLDFEIAKWYFLGRGVRKRRGHRMIGHAYTYRRIDLAR
jgi:hypothetical protein